MIWSDLEVGKKQRTAARFGASAARLDRHEDRVDLFECFGIIKLQDRVPNRCLSIFFRDVGGSENLNGRYGILIVFQSPPHRGALFSYRGLDMASQLAHPGV